MTNLHALSFNLRYNNPADGQQAWPFRKTLAASVFSRYPVDIAGLQEVLHGQLHDLIAHLPDYDWVGVGRDDGAHTGEFAPVFYRRKRFELLETGTFWLSETPNIAGSIGWDASLPRIATWARLEDKSRAKQLLVINTHLDHLGERARRESCLLICHKLSQLAGQAGILLLGDFNLQAHEAGIQLVLQNPGPHLYNTRSVSQEPHFGGEHSVHDFGRQVDGGCIDYIFCSEHFRVLRHGFLQIQENGLFVSDHWPVWTQLADVF